MTRVVITGIGGITPLGLNIHDTWAALKSGRHAVEPITRFDTQEHKAKLACQVKGFDPADFMDKKDARRMDLFCRYAVAAALMAQQDAALDMTREDPTRVGVHVGSGIGGIETTIAETNKLNEKGAGRVSPLMVPMMIGNMASGSIAIRFGIKGYSNCPVTACATGAHALGDAFRLIKHGYQDVMFAGGAEAAIVPLAVSAFANMQALSESRDPDRASLPFDAERAGFIMGEGAAVLILEGLEHAQRRGARIYGEIAGYGATTDAYHITAPEPEGVAATRAMLDAVAEAGLSRADIGYINAHGTGTPLNDLTETRAIKAAFGEAAARMPISSTKSMTGHMLGAAGALEAIVTLLTLREGFAHPTAGLLIPDPECDLDYIPLTGRAINARAALSNSLGFGGHNASLCLKAAEG